MTLPKGPARRNVEKLLSCEIAEFVERNTVSYSAAISACEKAGNWSVMLLLLEEMHLV